MKEKNMYRGTSLNEVQNIIRGNVSGGFWSNYYELAYISGALLVAKNREPQLSWSGEIPGRYHLHLKEIKRIYVDNYFLGIRFPLGLVQVFPVLTESAFRKLCTTPFCRKSAHQFYKEYIESLKKNKLYTKK